MRRLVIIILSFLLCVLDASAQIDSTKLRELDARLDQYYAILEPEPVEVKNQECDALIAAASDPSLRQVIAKKIYDHYSNSPVMGEEAVAIHLIDTWFAPGLVSLGSEKDLFEAKLFAEFNRSSLLGMPAPEVTLSTPNGMPVTLGGEGDRFRVLYFYDTDCAKCKLETAMLRSLLDDKDYPVDVYAIYVGREPEGWKRWRESSFVLKAESTGLYHLWDQDNSSDFQLEYGVIKTPRMFLLDKDGIIIGRGLDTEALEQLLDACLEEEFYEYGSEGSRELFDNLFSIYGSKVAPGDVSDVAAMIRTRTLERGDTVAYKHLEGDLLYYLASKRVEGFREGTAGFIKEHIFSRPDVWNTVDDSLQVIGLAEMLDGLLSKSPVGSRIPKMPVKGWNRIRRKGGYLFFHVENCPVCKEQMAIADSLGLEYLSVDMDKIGERSPSTALKLLDAFDLSSLPYVLETGRKGIVKRRYLNLIDSLSYLEEKE